MRWNNININKNKIKQESDKSVMICMPNSSRYKGFVFWHLKKLVREGRNKNAISIGFTNDFIFRLKKYGKGQFNNFDVLQEIEISSLELEEAFRESDSSIHSKKKDRG